MTIQEIKDQICELLFISSISAREAKAHKTGRLLLDANWSKKETWLTYLEAVKKYVSLADNVTEENTETITVENEIPDVVIIDTEIADDNKVFYTQLQYLVDVFTVTNITCIIFDALVLNTIEYLVEEIRVYTEPSNIYTWSYIDHEATGSYKVLPNGAELQSAIVLLNTLNTVLPSEKRINMHKTVIQITMKPKNIITKDVNGRVLNRIEKQQQQNNNYHNRRRTLMSTTDSPGRNVGQASVKESILYKSAKLLPEPFIRDGKANIKGIALIAVNGHQVYPCTLISHLNESNPAINLLDDYTKDLILSNTKIDNNLLTPEQIANLKTYNRRKEIATAKVKQYSFQHCRGKIRNGFSPSFEANGKKYCLQIDQENRVKIWKLSNDNSYTVNPNDLIKGRELCDVGYLEVKAYTVKQWVNRTLDMVKGGQEARLERFDYITKQLNKQILINDKAVFDYMSKLKDNKDNALKVQNLKVVDEVITGQLYGSELIIAKRDVHKHKVVLHPTAKIPEQYVTIANIWINSLPREELFHKTNKPNNLGLNSINNRTRKEIKKVGLKPIQNSKDRKYLIKMLSKFTTDGIYGDKEKFQYLGKLVLTDGSCLISQKREIIHYTEKKGNKEVRKTKKGKLIPDYSLIERIVDRVLDTFPVTIKIATLMTPSHHTNTEEFPMFLLKILKFYGQVELGLLINGRIQLITDTDGTDTVFINWCNGIHQYLKRQNVAVGVITISDALSMLKKYSYSKEKEMLLTNVPTAAYNNDQLLEDITGHNKTKINSFRAELEKLSGMYDSLIYDLRFKNGLENE